MIRREHRKMFQTIISLYDVFMDNSQTQCNIRQTEEISPEALVTDPYFFLGRTGITMENKHINNCPENRDRNF